MKIKCKKPPHSFYKNFTIKLLLSSTLLLSTLNAGGKAISPVEVEVLPVPEESSAWYLGAGLLAAKFHACKNDCSYEDQTFGAMLRGGYEFNEYFGVELRGLRTFLDEGPFGGVPLQHVGIYAKPQYPLSEDFNLYTLLGYGYTQNLGNGNRLNYFDDDHGFSAGLGLEYVLLDDWTIFADYQRLLIKSDVPDMDAVSLGLRYDF